MGREKRRKDQNGDDMLRNSARSWPDEDVSEQVLINVLCLSNYLAPSSCCRAGVPDEVSDIPAWPGQVVGWQCHLLSGTPRAG